MKYPASSQDSIAGALDSPRQRPTSDFVAAPAADNAISSSLSFETSTAEGIGTFRTPLFPSPSAPSSVALAVAVINSEKYLCSVTTLAPEMWIRTLAESILLPIILDDRKNDVASCAIVRMIGRT
jgi:hypothetical protein